MPDQRAVTRISVDPDTPEDLQRRRPAYARLTPAASVPSPYLVERESEPGEASGPARNARFAPAASLAKKEEPCLRCA